MNPGANATIRWNDEIQDEKDVYISFGVWYEAINTDSFGVNDDDIFYYCSGEEELKSLMVYDARHDFTVLSYEVVE